MSNEERRDESGNRLSRRDFLAMSAVGAGLLASVGYLGVAQAQRSPQQQREGQLVHRGKKIVVERRGGRPEIRIEGERIEVIDSNGAYRAAGYMFSPQSNPEDLAREVVDYRVGLSRR